MIRKLNLGATAAALSLAILAAPARAQNVTTLQNDLNAKYKSDAVLVIQKNGVTGEAPNNLAPPCPSTWRDNALHAASGICQLVERLTPRRWPPATKSIRPAW